MPKTERDPSIVLRRSAGPVTPSERDRELAAALLVVTPLDLARVDAVWDRLAPPAFQGLMSAPRAGSSRPGFWWNPDRALFAKGGSYVPAAKLRAAINAFNKAHAAEMEAIARAAASEALAAPQFHGAMIQAVKDGQLVNAIAGRGGKASITRADLGKVGESVDYQMDRLERFADEIDELTPEEAGWRAAAYGKMPVGTFDGMRRRAGAEAGYTMERNVLGSAEHCYWSSKSKPQPRPDCPSLTGLGWVGIGRLTPIGERLCLWNCKCHIEFGG
jgi:hypothetical protein